MMTERLSGFLSELSKDEGVLAWSYQREHGFQSRECVRTDDPTGDVTEDIRKSGGVMNDQKKLAEHREKFAHYFKPFSEDGGGVYINRQMDCAILNSRLCPQEG